MVGENMLILAVDPGKTTGWAFKNTSEFQVKYAESMGIQFGEFKWFEFLDRYQAWMMEGHIDVTVCESFIITRETLKKTRQNWSLEAIGVMRFLSAQRGKEFVLQSPGEAKKFATNDKLKKIDWWPTGQDHAQDAARHLLTYVAANSEILGFDLSQIL
jgi:hypothetical protein